MESNNKNDDTMHTSLEGYTCQQCQQPAKLQCPKCLELKLEQDFSTFCSQECFKVCIASMRLSEKWHLGCARCFMTLVFLNVLCRKRGRSTRRFINLEITHGTIVYVEERVGHYIVLSSSGLGPFDHTELGLQGKFQTPFQRLIITEMEFRDLKSGVGNRVLVCV